MRIIQRKAGLIVLYNFFTSIAKGMLMNLRTTAVLVGNMSLVRGFRVAIVIQAHETRLMNLRVPRVDPEV